MHSEHPSIIEDIVLEGDIHGIVNVDAPGLAVNKGSAGDCGGLVSVDDVEELERRSGSVVLTAVDYLHS